MHASPLPAEVVGEDVVGVEVAGEGDRERVRATIVLAFASDPVARWVYQDAGAFLAHFPTFVDAFAGAAFAHGSAQRTDDLTGAALWLPPGAGPDEEAIAALFERTLPEDHRPRVFELIEQMGRHHPAEPHWYLPLIAVDPARQNRGRGSALLRQMLGRLDREGQVAYLESSNPRNLPLYRRLGFEPCGRIQVADSAPLLPMIRYPR